MEKPTFREKVAPGDLGDRGARDSRRGRKLQNGRNHLARFDRRLGG